jgi:hypothetical protein
MALDLKTLQSKNIGSFQTELQFLPKQRKGHFDFSLFLKDTKGELSRPPVIKGICSKGNRRQHIQNWFDFHYYDRADFGGGNPVILSQTDKLAEELFRLVGTAVEPGGMLFVSYITDKIWNMKSDLHRITRDCFSMFSLNIPPAATPLGRLLFCAGCLSIKSQAFDVQGSSRIAGEKALDKENEKRFSLKLSDQLEAYLKREPHPERMELEGVCRLQAALVLREIRCPSTR